MMKKYCEYPLIVKLWWDYDDDDDDEDEFI